MLNALNGFDHRLFLSIHQWRNDFFDFGMPWVTNRWAWIPLYAVLVFLLWRRFGKQLLLIAPVVALLIFASDQTANLLKNTTHRYRPCHEEGFNKQVLTPVGCGGDYGFVSGHAANSAALALFLWLLSGVQKGFPPARRRALWLLLFPWVILVCWSRIYVGVHFPFDLLGGCIVGMCYAVVLYFLYKKFIPVLR